MWREELESKLGREEYVGNQSDDGNIGKVKFGGVRVVYVESISVITLYQLYASKQTTEVYQMRDEIFFAVYCAGMKMQLKRFCVFLI